MVAALVVALRLDELYRAVDAGAHAAGVEQKIARRLNNEGFLQTLDEDALPLTWESREARELREPEPPPSHRKAVERSGIRFLLLLWRSPWTSQARISA